MKTVVSRVGSRQGWGVRELREGGGETQRDQLHETEQMARGGTEGAPSVPRPTSVVECILGPKTPYMCPNQTPFSEQICS